MTDDLTEYFPMTEKVVARTARDWQSVIFSNTHPSPDSTASENPAPAPPSRFSSSTEGSVPLLPSRFSTSTEGSARLLPSRFSTSTEGSARLLTSRFSTSTEGSVPLLPSRFSSSTEGSSQPRTSYDEDVEDEEEVEDPDEDGMLNAPDESDGETGIGETPQARTWIKGALIGVGPFGQVYLGMDGSTGLVMAVKQVELPTRSAPNQEKLSALEREIELLKDLQHENIVQYLYSLLDDKYLNVFLEYVPGGSVATLLRNYGAFEEPLAINFVRQILEGLNYLHERDIVHCDIKAAHILVDNKGGIKISDFSILKKVENLLTSNHKRSPSLQGSVFWMAPEVVKQGPYTLKADIWSVGCLAVEMLTGEHPWAPLTQMQVIFKIGSSAKPTIPSNISSDAQDFLMRTFELDHEARPSAAELLLHAWVCTEGSAPLLPSRFSSSTEGSSQHRTSYDQDVEGEDKVEDSDEDGMLNASDEESDSETGAGEKPQAIKWIKGALIGIGSFAEVYLGMDESTGLLMAVKQIEIPIRSAPNQEYKKLKLNALEREIELLKDLQHENIVQYLYSLLDGKYLNVFLEYVPGGSVAALLRNYGAFEEPLAKNFVRQILEGLNHLHKRDIIHCDIKGANILVDNKGGIRISSFGLSKKVENNLLTSDHLHSPLLQGSAFCMAPEVVKQGTYTLKADIWSVGCLAVEMLTGEHPWAPRTQMQAIFKIGSSAKPTIPSDISSDAQDFLMRTFELDHQARPSAAELLLHAWVRKKRL